MALIIAKELNIEDFDERNLKCCCPFHQEKTPSFIWNRKTGRFHCFGACGQSYDIIDVFMKKGMTYIEAVQKLFEYADIRVPFGEHHAKTEYQYRYPHEEPLGDKTLVYAYLAKRKISKETADYLDIRQDAKGNCVLNYYDTNDTLTMVKYRPSRKIDKSKGDIKNWVQPNSDSKPLLYNMNRINVDKPLLICSGELDCAAAIEAGWQNAVSIPLGDQNTRWIECCWEWLEQFQELIICPDNDESGNKYCKDVVPRLGSWRTKIAVVPSDCKDVNECLYKHGKDETLHMILDAKDTPVDSVADFADIKNIDLNDMDGIETGIEALDRKLMKLFYGTLTILTGGAGAGKTSLLSQIVCQTLDEQKNVFFYSGELPNFQTKNWLNYILAGQRNLTQHDTPKTTYWTVNPNAQKQMDDYYRGRLFIYKDGHDNKVSSILQSMEDATRKYGTKLLIVDNLTAVNLECSDDSKFQKQAEFVQQLIMFAKKYSTAVVLVVHPRKTECIRRLTRVDVQGISAIVDLAHRILSLYRVSESDKRGVPSKRGDGYVVEPIHADVVLDVLKDRMLGWEGYSCELFYDRPSRRFFTSYDDLDHRYKWDKTDYDDLPLPYGAPQLEEEEEVFGHAS